MAFSLNILDKYTAGNYSPFRPADLAGLETASGLILEIDNDLAVPPAPTGGILISEGFLLIYTNTDLTAVRTAIQNYLGGLSVYVPIPQTNAEKFGSSIGAGVNTASNVGVGGVGAFKQKTGSNLEFKNINAGSTKVTVVNDPGNNEIDIDVVESTIVHQNLSGAGSNTHATIDTHLASASNPHSVTKAQVGLTNVTNDAQLKRSANDFTTFVARDQAAAGDFLLVEDYEDGFNKKKLDVGMLTSFPQHVEHRDSVLNPHSVTKAQVGLTNVTNDAQLKIASNLSDVANANTSFNSISPVTTKGDLIVRNATVNVRQGIGVDGAILIADSTLANGLKWDVNNPKKMETISIDTADWALTTSVWSKSLLGTGAVNVLSGDGGDLRLGTTEISRAHSRINLGANTFPFWNRNPVFWAMDLQFAELALAGAYTMWAVVGGGNTSSTELSLTDKYIGFEIGVSAGISTTKCVNSDGDGGARTETTITFDATLNHSIGFIMTSGTNIKFYVDGVLVATHTTNLPTGARDSGANSHLFNFAMERVAAGGTTDQRVRISPCSVSFQIEP